MHTGTELIKKQSATAMVAAHDEAIRLAEEGFKTLAKAKGLLREAFGEYNCNLWGDRLTTYNWTPDDVDYQMQDTTPLIKTQAWRGIMGKVGVEDLMSAKRKEGLKRQIEAGDTPDFTLENVLAMFQGMGNEMTHYMEEAVKEVFDWLRPWRRVHKTNDPYQVGPKVIKEFVVAVWGSTFTMSHYNGKENNLHDLDRVFHLLDGQGVPKYPGDFVTAIKEAMSAGEPTAETEYFKAHWYKKGTMHIEFLRLDLLEQLNAVAGGANLRPGEEK